MSFQKGLRNLSQLAEKRKQAYSMTEADEIYAGLIRQGRYRELLEQFFRDEGENIFNVVLHTVGDYTSAQDLVQESFFKIHRYVKQIRIPESYRFWAYRIAVNTCRTYLRQQQKDMQRMNDQVEDIDIVDQSLILPDEQFQHQSLRQILHHALSELTPAIRTAVLLHYYHGYKYEEIAEILSLPLNTVKSHIHRGKQRLSKLLDRKKVEDAF